MRMKLKSIEFQIIIVLMAIIFNLLLALSIFLLPTHSHPFANSDFSVKIRSGNNSQKTIPAKLDCSCQLIVYPIQVSGYFLNVSDDKANQTHAKLYVQSSQKCYVQSLTGGSAEFPLPNPHYLQQTNEITQRFSITLFTPHNQAYFHNAVSTFEQCFSGEQSISYRQAYLINETKFAEDGYHYSIQLPINAIAFTQILALLLLFLLSSNIKYRRFTPFAFNFPFSVLYALFLFVTVYIQTKFQDKFQIFFWIVLLASVIFSTLYFIDITSLCLNSTALIIAISTILALLIAVIDVFILPDVWYINNLLGILVAGALIKFIVIKKLKSAIIPLLFLWVFFILRQFPLLLRIEEFHEALQIRIIPLFLQLPAMLGDNPEGFVCSAFGTSKIITMGLIMNYCVRIDLFLSTRFYTALCAIFATICLGIQFLILNFKDDLPVLEYTSVIIFIPVVLGLILMLSSKRGQWAVTWHGSFHDIAVDRKSIKRESSKLNQEQLDRNIEQLRMNPSLLQSM